MKNHLENLRHRHRRLDRLIDTSKAAGKQENIKILKRIRLKLKDRIAALQQNRKPVTQ